MESIAIFMQNDTAVITLGIVATILGVIGVILLGVVSAASTFVGRLPGGMFSLAGVAIILAMYAFASLMTSTMGLQYGPQGVVVENSVYTLGGFFCVLGYARLAWWVARRRRDAR